MVILFAWGFYRSLATQLTEMRHELREEIKDVRNEVKEVRDEVKQLTWYVFTQGKHPDNDAAQGQK